MIAFHGLCKDQHDLDKRKATPGLVKPGDLYYCHASYKSGGLRRLGLWDHYLSLMCIHPGHLNHELVCLVC